MRIPFLVLALLACSAESARGQVAVGHMTASAEVVEPASVSVLSGRVHRAGGGRLELEGAVAVGGRTRAITRVESVPVRVGGEPVSAGTSSANSLGSVAAAAAIPARTSSVRGTLERLPTGDEAVRYRVELLN